MKKYLRYFFLIILVTLIWVLWSTISNLNNQITRRFEGRRWELPARIYGRSLDLFSGKTLPLEQLQLELDQLRYRSTQTQHLEKPGEYFLTGSRITIFSRAFSFPDNPQSAQPITVQFSGNHIISLENQQTGEPLSLFRLEPLHIASIYPGDNEDRLLIRIKDTPELLIKALLLTEDKTFYHHIGVRPFAIFRALLANVKAGKTVQGGSTLTQQLVKNFFLTSEKSIRRKLNGAIMALLVEYHYEKDEILEAYLNEIFLGQGGKRAIHGFAMASKFYFGRNIQELSADQLALLIGLAKGASYYNPRRHPERAKSRRNLILGNMITSGLLTEQIGLRLQQEPLGITKHKPSGITRYPAFIKLVRRQLKRDYNDEDLRNEGLSIFTTFDPFIQHQAENKLQRILTDLETEKKMDEDTLQGAFIICSSDQGEVQAVIGDRFVRQDGFNRVLEMKRPSGSVVKPAIYLTALARQEQYNLLTLLDDSPLSIPFNGEDWQPQNYDKAFHGSVPLMQSLAHSYNVATVRLGMELGIESIIDTLHLLGISREIPPYPSLLLGAIEFTPIEILQMYQSLAAGGYRTPLRSILAVTDKANHLLHRYPLTVKEAASPSSVFCLTRALQEVTRTGTARALKHMLPPKLLVAGKTGTTNDLRDSWFAGFTGSHVAVAWVGRDNNKPTQLTGSTGALRIWGSIMASITTSSLDLNPPEDIDFYYSNTIEGKLFADQCQRGELIPFIRNGILPPVTSCGLRDYIPNVKDYNQLPHEVEKTFQDLLRIFQ